jgi:3D (Asp-Asp-Asp) domain-containing protein
MKTAFALTAVTTLLMSACATSHPTQTRKTEVSTPAQKPRTVKPGTRMTVRTTAYHHSEPGGRANGVGGRLRFGGAVYSAAADWSWLPLGTRFRMCCNDRTYVIEDYGSALVGRRTIDLYMPTRRMMHAWGCRHEDIEILEWGSSAMSLKLLKDRQRHSHVRTMVTALRSKVRDTAL